MKIFERVFFTIFIIFIVLFLILSVTLLVELFLADFYGERVEVIGECRDRFGKTMIGIECKTEVRCLSNSLLLKGCEEYLENGK